MSAGFDRFSLLDHDRSACLCDVGLPGYVAAVCVASSGEDRLWLVSETELGAQHARCGRAEQPHEMLGRLPQAVRERIWGDSLRCGRARSNGQPCRQRVKQPGQTCAAHCDGQSCGKCSSCYVNHGSETSR
jgi:hypothetical protein